MNTFFSVFEMYNIYRLKLYMSLTALARGGIDDHCQRASRVNISIGQVP